ncbi:MAG: sensor histidine kinase [Sarcina sp.]
MHTFRGKSIQFIVTISFTIISILSITILGNFLYFKVANLNKKNFMKNTELILDQVNLNLDYYIKNMMSISDSIYYNIIKNSEYDAKAFYDSAKITHNINKDFLVNISIFSEEGKLIDSYPNKQLNYNIEVGKQEWFTSAVKNQENLHFSLPKKQNLFKDTLVNEIISLSRSIEIYDENGQTKQGIMLLDMNYRGIEQIFNDITITENSYVYLTNNIGNIIYYPDKIQDFTENNAISSQYSDGSIYEEFNGMKRLITLKTVGYTAWKIVSVIPTSDITNMYRGIGVFFVMLMILMILILIFVNKLVSKKISGPLINLTNKVIEFENGNEETDFVVGGSYEVEHLGNALNFMVMKMNRLIRNIIIEQESKRKLELDILQAQINPHFLYNTLDSVIWMVECEKNKEAIVMTSALAKLFRISLNKGKNLLLLSDEINHIESYLTIQKIRYKDRFDVEINIGEGLENLQTLKLIIQPIIENAIYHGVESLYDEGEIKIDVFRDDLFLFIVISDNGIGIKEEKLETILKKKRNFKSNGSGVGLRNVNERIKLYFGDEYGLTIKSELDIGTEVTITLPIIEAKVEKVE